MTAQIEPPHLNLQCLSSRFWFWRFIWWAWKLFCSVLRIILFQILWLFFTTGMGTSLLHLIIINLSNVSSFNLHLSGLNTLPPEQPFNSSWRSNVKQYRPLSDCSWSRCALFAQVYICPNVCVKYSVLSLQQVWQIQQYTNSSSL